MRPGETTVFDVEMSVYPRVEMQRAELAPMTSMFFYGPNDRNDIDDFRPSVHDSDGLAIFNGKGESLWRPLSKPATSHWSTRFGAVYDFMIVLDADSLMSGQTIVRLVHAIETNPTAGLVQSLPLIVNARSLFSRVQQFAGRLYGPMIAAAMRVWLGGHFEGGARRSAR